MKKLLQGLETDTVLQWLLLGIVVVPGLLLLPTGLNTLETTKFLWLLITLVLGTGVTILMQFSSKNAASGLVLHPVMSGVGFLAVATLISLIVGNSHPMAQLAGFGGTWLGFFGIVCLGFWFLRKVSASQLAMVLGSTGSLLTLLLVMEVIGLKVSTFYNALLGNSLAQSTLFTPVGSVFILAQFCVLAVVGCGAAVKFFPQRRTIFLTTLIINSLGLLLAGWLSLPEQPANPVILPWSASWSIALDSMRSVRHALVGVGPDNYSDAFTQFKPNWLNTTPWWNVEFTQGSTLSLSIIVTHGLLGFLAWLYLTFVLLKNARHYWQTSPVATSLTLAGLALAWLTPPTTFMMGIWAVCLAYLFAETKHLYPTLEEHSSSATWKPLSAFYSTNTKALHITKTSLVGLLGLTLTFFTAQLIRAEVALFQANKQTLKGDIVQLYESQKSAISIFPYNNTARRQYALTNLAIASAVSNKADITEEDGKKIAVLVQQAIREARAAVLIDPKKAQSWETLGDIYTNFIGTMDNSDTLALEAYRQAIAYAPANPTLYIKLGGVFYRQGSFNEALISFEQAARTKPDLANAYYNAANTFKQLNDIPGATAAYQQTLLVLEKTTGSSSEEYLRANLELEQLQQPDTASNSAKTTE
jgi:tetratricopeptide (TPR) repeat protein